ncbi:zinc finger BED domain-containing protein 4-like [Centruroides sculpturatus]|uniref:zinc finger BED domain-containing protein 4-like n=1 Tax=Centruroides sculpturatus TaxID=218467 RepID=UPI000C6DA585|nr:zinc finger BED domain-containing protein 4-like [Centruroides sculpturatus]
MIALDNEPLSLVERVGFKRLMEKAVPQYNIPGRTYMTEKIIPDIYNRICYKIESSISRATAVSVTSDMWTCQHNNQSFLSFTVHWISPEFILEHGVLAMKPFSGSHTGTNIAKELNAIAERWNIPHSKIHLLVHDSGANMIKGVRDAEYDSANCFIHSLQRAVKESLKSQTEITQMVVAARRIVTHFNHSGIAQEKLKCIRQELNLPNHQLVQDVSTRWNSTYYLMERLLEQKRAVSLYITDHESLNNLTPSQWELMEQCIKLLKPFEEITKITSSGISCISEVIPHVVTLLKYLGKEETADRTPNLLRMRSSLQVELETRFNFDENDKYLVATFLDPRFKTSFLGLVQTQRAKQKILLEALKISHDESTSTGDSSPFRKKRNINENDKTIEIHDSF